MYDPFKNVFMKYLFDQNGQFLGGAESVMSLWLF